MRIEQRSEASGVPARRERCRARSIRCHVNLVGAALAAVILLPSPHISSPAPLLSQMNRRKPCADLRVCFFKGVERPGALKGNKMRSIRRKMLLIGLLAAGALGPACASATGLDGLPETVSADSDAGTSDGGAPRDDARRVVDSQSGSLYEPCVGHDDDGRGSCSGSEICGTMPNVGYTYCMPAPPCLAGMESVINLVCFYPCDDASACAEHGLARCAENTLPEPTHRPAGWCTP